jgi:murein DD-endopeptidase MepM/ murein hydrolase activator NlpD
MRVRPAAAALLLAAALGGCSDRFGTAVAYNPLSTDPIPITMDPGAPHIAQQFIAPSETPKVPGHLGIDFWTHVGTPVLAAAPGRVAQAFFDPVFGFRITIDHGTDAEGRHILTHYFHLSRLGARVGDAVARGQRIGASGANGAAAVLIPHLHFEVLEVAAGRKAVARDPQLYWAGGVGKVTCFDPRARYPRDRFVTTVPLPCRGAAR